jgi:hypothetical protein
LVGEEEGKRIPTLKSKFIQNSPSSDLGKGDNDQQQTITPNPLLLINGIILAEINTS